MSPRSLAALGALWLACTPQAAASVMGGDGGVTLDKTVTDEGGGPDAFQLLGPQGGYSLSLSLGEPFGSSSPQAASPQGATAVSPGFWDVSGTGQRPSALASVAGLSSGGPQGGEVLGTPCASSATVTFDNVMLPGPLAAATTVTLLVDRLGRSVGRAVPAALSYSDGPSRLSVTDAGGCWPANHVYQVTVASAALSFDGLPLAVGVSLVFHTLADPTTDNVMAPLSDLATAVRVASGTFSGPFLVRVNTDLPRTADRVSPAAVEEADRKAGAPVVALRELTALDAAFKPLPAAFAPGQVSLTMPYPDADGDGLVDGFGSQARVKRLAVYALDEDKRLWVRLPGSGVDPSARLVSASLPHFSAYALIAPRDESTADAYAFPVPFRPHGPNAGSGAGQTGTEAGGITFLNLPSDGSVEVYNVRGELVWSAGIPDAGGKLAWDVHNSAGEPVASGVYFYIVRSGSNVKTGKLAVVR